MKIPEIVKICLDSTFHKISITETVDKLNKIDKDNFAEFIQDLFTVRIRSNDNLFEPSSLYYTRFFSRYFYDNELYVKFNIPKVYYFSEKKNNQFICNFSIYFKFYIPIRTSELDVLFEGYIDFKYNINSDNCIIISDDLKLNNVNIRVFDENKQCITVSSMRKDVKPKIQKLVENLISNIIFNDFGVKSYTMQSKF